LTKQRPAAVGAGRGLSPQDRVGPDAPAPPRGGVGTGPAIVVGGVRLGVRAGGLALHDRLAAGVPHAQPQQAVAVEQHAQGQHRSAKRVGRPPAPAPPGSRLLHAPQRPERVQHACAVRTASAGQPRHRGQPLDGAQVEDQEQHGQGQRLERAVAPTAPPARPATRPPARWPRPTSTACNTWSGATPPSSSRSIDTGTLAARSRGDRQQGSPAPCPGRSRGRAVRSSAAGGTSAGPSPGRRRWPADRAAKNKNSDSSTR